MSFIERFHCSHAHVSICGTVTPLFIFRERERGGKSDEGEELLYRPPPVAPRSSTGEPRRRGKTVVDVAVDTQQSLEGGEKMLKTIEVCFIINTPSFNVCSINIHT